MGPGPSLTSSLGPQMQTAPLLPGGRCPSPELEGWSSYRESWNWDDETWECDSWWDCRWMRYLEWECDFLWRGRGLHACTHHTPITHPCAPTYQWQYGLGKRSTWHVMPPIDQEQNVQHSWRMVWGWGQGLSLMVVWSPGVWTLKATYSAEEQATRKPRCAINRIMRVCNK